MVTDSLQHGNGAMDFVLLRQVINFVPQPVRKRKSRNGSEQQKREHVNIFHNNSPSQTRVRTIFSVENSRCFQGIFKDKFKKFKVKVPKHEITKIKTSRSENDFVIFFRGGGNFMNKNTEMHTKLTKVKEIWGKEIEKLIQKEVWIKDPIVTLLQNFCKYYIAVIIMQT